MVKGDRSMKARNIKLMKGLLRLLTVNIRLKINKRYLLHCIPQVSMAAAASVRTLCTQSDTLEFWKPHQTNDKAVDCDDAVNTRKFVTRFSCHTSDCYQKTKGKKNKAVSQRN